jgi:retron-type reverse transcriptase
MKTYKNLWDEFISRENFDLAAKKAIKSKKSRKSVKRFLAHREELIEKLRDDLKSGRYKTSNYHTFTIYEPKQRIIYKLPLYPDHVLHHALINVLGPIWQKSFIHNSYACIPGRGLLGASQKTMHFIRRNKYVLQCDIRKFFPSINHEIMKNIIKRKIHDRRIVKVLSEIIDSVGGDTNLPIGNLTSQWMGNVYLNELDSFVKYRLGWHDYIRYCDDFCLYGNDKKQLHMMERKISVFLNQHLNMVLSKSNVKKTSDGISFIGYRHFKNFILIRKDTAKRLKKRISCMLKYKNLNTHAIGQMAALYGWTKWANCFHLKICLYKIAKKYNGDWFIKKYLLRF